MNLDYSVIVQRRRKCVIRKDSLGNIQHNIIRINKLKFHRMARIYTEPALGDCNLLKCNIDLWNVREGRKCFTLSSSENAISYITASYLYQLS